MNTRINYSYRQVVGGDEVNASMVFAGEMTDKEKSNVTRCLSKGNFFLPKHVGLPCNDVLWADNFSMRPTEDPAVPGYDIHVLAENFRIIDGNWNPNDSHIFPAVNPYVASMDCMTVLRENISRCWEKEHEEALTEERKEELIQGLAVSLRDRMEAIMQDYAEDVVVALLRDSR